ncbi:MAG: DUF1428 domain-containing protein [Beijerinckiaceae bacterium]|nr:DUF1428 domain-containing protein [Beijerinckiaceae bacterium]
MPYIDGFVAAVPSGNREAYLEHATLMGGIMKEFGAIRLVECWGDDVPDGKLTSFPMAVKAEPDETVVFSWVVWPSKAVRDAGWARMMQDPRMQPGAQPMPYDGKRLIYGGFEMALEI